MQRLLLLFLILAICEACSSKVVRETDVPNVTSAESETGEKSVDYPELSCDEQEGPSHVSSDRQISFENVLFSLDPNWIRDVEYLVTPACFLTTANFKPDGIGGRTATFHLRYSSSDDEATISVFEIEEYKAAFAKYPQYVENRDGELKSLILERSVPRAYGIDPPPHVTWMDASETFYAKATVLDFHGGAGLLTVTQITQDAYINISNARLRFLFQGFTTGGKYFVEMNFPAKLKWLPDEEDEPVPLAPGEEFDSQERRQKYNKYILETAARINKAAPHKFRPQLGQIERFIREFEIRSDQGGVR